MQGHDYQMAAYRTVPKEFKPITSNGSLTAIYKTMQQIAGVGAFADKLKKHLFHGHDLEVTLSEVIGGLEHVESRRDLMLVNAALGLAGEGGEFTEHIAQHLFHGEKLDQQYLEKELGDQLWYIAMACTALNVSMDLIMDQNVEKLNKRYPNGFSSEASINRTE